MPSQAFRSELRDLVRLAAPLAASQAGAQLMGVVDVAVLGRLGARELAGAGLGNAVYFAFSVFGIGMMLGIEPLIAQAVGAGNRLRARWVFWQGVWLCIAVSAVLTVLMLLGARALPLIGTQPELLAPAHVFLVIRTMSLLPFLMFFVARSYLQAHGMTRPIVAAMIIANILNLVLDIALVFGIEGWIPAMGVAGAATSTGICTLVQLAIVGAAVRAVKVEGHVDPRPNRAEIRQAFRVGLPVGLHMGAEVGIFALVALLAGRLGTLQLASHQLVINIASFTFSIAVGIASAGTVRVGAAIGGRDPRATRRAGHAAFVAGSLFMSGAALVFALAPGGVARLVTDQPSVIAASIPLMIVAAVFQLSDGIQAVGAGVLRGAGDTKFTFYANMVGHWLVGFPLALLLGFHYEMGIVGLWWGLCAGLTVVAVLLFHRFDRLSRGVIAPL